MKCRWTWDEAVWEQSYFIFIFIFYYCENGEHEWFRTVSRL